MEETIRSEIKEYVYDNGDRQRVQIVRFDDFGKLRPLSLEYDEASFTALVKLYKEYIVPKYAWFFPMIVLFHLPDDIELPFASDDDRYGIIYDRTSLLKRQFEKSVRFVDGQFRFHDEKTEKVFRLLQEKGALCCIQGKRRGLRFLSMSHELGFLSKEKGRMLVNSSFFVMDVTDQATIFDQMGMPVGLNVADGEVITPPLFDREVFAIDRNGRSSVRKMSLKDVQVIIDGKTFTHGVNAAFYSRPRHGKTPSGGNDVIIVNDRIMAFKKGGNSVVPSGAFVLKSDQINEIKGLKVSYGRMDDLQFAIQGGNSVCVDGIRTKRFISPFHHILNVFSPAYPPSLYPLNYHKDRAPRIVLGADKEGKGILLWFEGAGKFADEKGTESCGASLSEAAAICEDLGIYNGIHLDGGGSAQILIDGERNLKLSDRDEKDLSQQERAVPMGLCIK